MPRQDEWNRDDRGRFTDDYRGSRNSSSNRYDRDRGEGRGYDQGDYQSRMRNDRDEYDDRGRSYSRGQHDQGHGGWFGDPRGHAEAARRGWQHRR